MTKRQFLLGLFILLTVVALCGVGGYYSLEQQRIAAQTTVETKRIEEQEATIRTKERWSWINRIPGLKEEK